MNQARKMQSQGQSVDGSEELDLSVTNKGESLFEASKPQQLDVFYDPYRRRRIVQIVTDEELKNPAYLKGVRDFSSRLNIPANRWLERLIDWYRDFDGFVCDHEFHVIDLNTEYLEVGPEWYRDWVNTPVPSGVMPRLRKESKPRIRVLATILKTAFPAEAATWGLSPANDNDRPANVSIVT